MQKDLQRLEAAGERLATIFRSRRASERRAALAGVELSGAAQAVLRCAIERGPLRITEIARVTHSGDPTTSRLVAQLERRGFLERLPDTADRRAVRIRATRLGRGTAARLRRAADEIFEAHLKSWNDSEVAQLADRLEKLCGDLTRES